MRQIHCRCTPPADPRAVNIRTTSAGMEPIWPIAVIFVALLGLAHWLGMTREPTFWLAMAVTFFAGSTR